jgi:outer membrane protein TolC
MWNNCGNKQLLVIVGLLFFRILLVGNSVYGQSGKNRLNLEDCIKIALDKSPYSQRATGERQQTLNGIYNALSPLLPQVQLSTEYSRVPSDDELLINPFIEPEIANIATNDNFEFSLTVSQSIVDASSWIQLKQNRTVSRAAEYNFLAARAELVYNVKKAFYELIQLYRNFKVIEASVVQGTEQLKVATERFRLGGISRPELLRIQTGLSQLRVDLIESTGVIENKKRNLANYLGISSTFYIDTTLKFPDTNSALPSEDSLIGLLSQKNPSTVTARLALEAQKQNHLSIKLQKVPSIDGFFTYGYSGPQFFSNLRNFWSLGIQLRWPVFEGLRWYGQFRESSLQIRTSSADLEISNNTAVEQMHQSYSNLKSSRDALSMVNLLMEQATEEFRLRQEQYRLGAASSEELLTSQVTFIEAQQKVVQIIVAYHLDWARILQLLGEW